MSLKCWFRRHDLDDQCLCRRCGRTLHDFALIDSCTTETGNFETSTEPWLTEMVKETVWKCRRCSLEKKESSTEWYLG